MTASVPQAVQLCHELLLWMIPQLDKFPRVRRFTLGERLENALLEVLELLVEAAYTKQVGRDSAAYPAGRAHASHQSRYSNSCSRTSTGAAQSAGYLPAATNR